MPMYSGKVAKNTNRVNLLTFCCGSGFSWTSPVIPKLQDVDPKINPLSETIKPSEVAWLVSITQLGCAFGPCFAGRLADKIGRVKALQCLALPLIIAYVMLAFAKHVYVFYIARFILGIGIGSVFQVVPMYLGEISEATNRGRICCFMAILSGLEELLAIVQFCKETSSKLSFFDIFKSRGLTRAFTINGGVALLAQLTGYMPVVAFMHTIFNAAGGDISPNIPPIIIGSLKCIVAIFFSAIVEKFGRKTLMLLSSFGCGVALTLLGTFFHLQNNHFDISNISWLPIACIIFFIFVRKVYIMATKGIEASQVNNMAQEVVYKPTTINCEGPLKSKKGSSTFLYLIMCIGIVVYSSGLLNQLIIIIILYYVFVVNLIGFSCGSSQSWTSPVIPKLEGSLGVEHNPLGEPITKLEGSLIAGILSLGCAIGPFISGPLADRYGRKITLLCIAVIVGISFITLAFATNVYVYYVARFLKGLGVGSTYQVMPMYSGEVAENTNRGRVGCLFVANISAGLLSSYLVGPYLSVRLFCIFHTTPIVIFLIFYKIIPESPIYLASKGDKVEAKASLMRLRRCSASGATDELKDILLACAESNSNKGGFREIFRSPPLKRAFLICFLLLTLQQFSGIAFVLAFMQNIFDAAGGSVSPTISAIIVVRKVYKMATKELEASQVNDMVKEVVYKPTTIDCEGPLRSKKGSSTFLYLIICIVNLIGFSCGSAISWTSPVIPKLEGSMGVEHNPLGEPITKLEGSLIAGILSLGCAVGPFISGPLADRYGRKITLLCIAAPVGISFITLAFATNVYVYYVARFLKGIGVGSTYQIIPMYSGEVAENTNRGRVGCLFIANVAAGLLSSYLVGPYLSVRLFCIFHTIPIVIFLMLYKFIPESPIYLASKGDKVEAKASLMRLRRCSASGVTDELIDIFQACAESNSNKGGFREIFRSPPLKKAFLICFLLLTLQQFTGIAFVLGFMQNIFGAAGGSISPSISAIIIGLLKTFASLFTSTVIEKFGRKILAMISALTTGIFITILGIFFFLQQNEYDLSNITWLPIVSLVFYITSFNLGMAPIPFVIVGEIFPSHVKSAASTLLIFIMFSTSFIITFLCPVLSSYLGMAPTFCMFGVFCVIGTVFIYFIVPETKGKSLAQIQDILKHR
ncbi:unnamed protein product [Brassicogethes aeneus]|uniref:Major facilitator superfamily (MFS) profile domain-containing protein n=1 Tax=Brassicogethes aeneus TaxID=1431903 RepID=A0A9P0FRR4_BRAAE|nr:unnamed protein product [Brassicogethes aeneus]